MEVIKWLKGWMPVRRAKYDTIVSVYRMRIADVQRLEERIAKIDSDTARDMMLARTEVATRAENPGHVDLLRQQLRQELAVGAWLQENLREGVAVSDFDALPKEARQGYFESVDALLR